jgi:PHD/YefM family antitoxin component YafN of YafNO toxin-antitoxin module
MTRHLPYDEFRKDPAKYMDQVGVEPLRIEREAGSVVMIAEDEFEGWKGNDPPPQQLYRRRSIAFGSRSGRSWQAHRA